jgi:hypothetical protein
VTRKKLGLDFGSLKRVGHTVRRSLLTSETPVDTTLETAVRQASAESELLRSAAAVRADGGVRLALGDARLRGLDHVEIALLESLGNSALDWSRVRVADGFNPRRVRNCEFHGDVVLGRFDGYARTSGGVDLTTGVVNSTIMNCVVGHNAAIRDVRLLANVAVGAGAVVADCGRVTCRPGAMFGNGAEVVVGPETGGREVPVYAELDGTVAAAVARPGRRRAAVASYREAVAEYAALAAADRSVIGAGATVWGIGRLEDTYVGPHARLDGADAVVNCTILSDAEDPATVESGANLSGVLLQWGGRVGPLAVVERSVVCEHATVEAHGRVRDSILGPNSSVGGGEVVSCLLGPFVVSHHQSLLIATLWPNGRGNIGYGANVGSNHTSRSPDQEFWPGEGMFIGLGVNVKFPCDFTHAPFTVIACGTGLPPQKVTFPFSLIMPAQDRHPCSPAYGSEIVPAWGLVGNAYSWKRCETKFRTRNKARRTAFDFAVFRPETVEYMRSACRRLEAVKEVKSHYTEHDIRGLGKSVLLEKDRGPAIEAYRFYTLYYALLGLMERVRELGASGSELNVGRLMAERSPLRTWDHQRRVLVQDFGEANLSELVRQLPAMAEKVATDVERSKTKDDDRGARIIADYGEVHPSGTKDPVVWQAWTEARRLGQAADGYLATVGLAGEVTVA